MYVLYVYNKSMVSAELGCISFLGYSEIGGKHHLVIVGEVIYTWCVGMLQAEVSVPWFSDVIVMFTAALQQCQQLKDKVSA